MHSVFGRADIQEPVLDGNLCDANIACNYIDTQTSVVIVEQKSIESVLASDFPLLGQYTNNERRTCQSNLDSCKEKNRVSWNLFHEEFVLSNIPNVLLKLATKARIMSRRRGPCNVCTYATSLNTFLAICRTILAGFFCQKRNRIRHTSSPLTTLCKIL